MTGQEDAERRTTPLGDRMKSLDRGFSEDWFDHNIPHWQHWLAKFRGQPGLRALEIGSFEGRSTLWLCENILTAHDARIDCVDLFQPDPVYGDYLQRFRTNTAAHQNRIREYAGPSFEMLRQVDGPYDIIYIDGWHSAFGVLADGAMTWPLLNIGGVMMFDDYLWVPPGLGAQRLPGRFARTWARLRRRDWRRELLEHQIASIAVDTPKLGIDGLLATLDGYYELLGITNQVAIRKTREFPRGQLGCDT